AAARFRRRPRRQGGGARLFWLVVSFGCPLSAGCGFRVASRAGTPVASSPLPSPLVTCNPPLVSHVLALERHGHATRPASCARELVTLDLDRILLVGPCLQ